MYFLCNILKVVEFYIVSFNLSYNLICVFDIELIWNAFIFPVNIYFFVVCLFFKTEFSCVALADLELAL